MEIFSEANQINDELINIRRYLHQHPELSNQEVATSEFITKELKALDIEVTTGVGGTGVVGLLKGKNPGKTIGIRADMDALPVDEETGLDFSSTNLGAMHACGHDLHMTIVLGVAKVLSKKRHKMNGNIKFIFQPAEEKLIGAAQMIADQVLEHPKVDAIIALHCWPDLPAGIIGVKKGEVMAAGDSIKIKVNGKQGHAAHPHKAIDPITISSYVITKLQTILSRELSPVDSAVITIGSINGGNAFNIIPSAVELSGTVRVLNPDVREALPNMIERIVKKTAESMNGEATTTYSYGPPPLINDDDMIDILDESVTEVLGNNKLVYMQTPSMGSEDFSFYLKHVPGVFFRLGTREPNVKHQYPLHHPKVTFDEDALVTGVSVMSQTALKFLATD